MQQKGGDESTNIQVGGNVQFGITYDDARQISLDVFKANFYELSEKAANKALERAEEITGKFIERFLSDEQQDKTKLEEPGVQSSLFEAQKAFAKTGDQNLEQRLLDILLARTQATERSLRQIILDEAILILPKLTENEVMLLSFCVSSSQVRYSGINSVQAFDNYINEAWVNFYPDNITTSEATHLQYCGCYTLPMLNGPVAFYSLGEYLSQGYKGLLTHGFTEVEFVKATNGMKIDNLGDFIIKNPRNSNVFQFNALHDHDFNNEISKLKLGANEQLLKALWNKSAMTKEQIHDLIIKINPRAKRMIDTYNKTAVPCFQLRPVGYAIAVSNINQKLGFNLDFMAYRPTG